MIIHPPPLSLSISLSVIIIIIMLCRPLSPIFPIVHRLRQVFWTTSRIFTYLLYVCSNWSSSFCLAISGVHRSTSLMSSSLLLQQCPACLVRLTWIIFVVGGRWPYSWCFVGCCRHDLFNITRTGSLHVHWRKIKLSLPKCLSSYPRLNTQVKCITGYIYTLVVKLW